MIVTAEARCVEGTGHCSTSAQAFETGYLGISGNYSSTHSYPGLQPAAVPEPHSLALLCVGVSVSAWARRRLRSRRDTSGPEESGAIERPDRALELFEIGQEHDIATFGPASKRKPLTITRPRVREQLLLRQASQTLRLPSRQRLPPDAVCPVTVGHGVAVRRPPDAVAEVREPRDFKQPDRSTAVDR